jgi:hypothetical protein
MPGRAWESKVAYLKGTRKQRERVEEMNVPISPLRIHLA